MTPGLQTSGTFASKALFGKAAVVLQPEPEKQSIPQGQVIPLRHAQVLTQSI